MEGIERLVRSRFANNEVISVVVTEVTDFSGDQILNIEIVHTDDLRIDPEVVISLTDELWSTLSGDANAAFPVTRFVSEADATRLDAA